MGWPQIFQRPQVTQVEGVNISPELATEFLCALADYSDIQADAVAEWDRQAWGKGSPDAKAPGGVLHEHDYRRERLLTSLANLIGVNPSPLERGLT